MIAVIELTSFIMTTTSVIVNIDRGNDKSNLNILFHLRKKWSYITLVAFLRLG